MAMSVREAFDKGTEAFNAHDMDAFAEIISDDVVQIAPGGIRAEGRPACIAFFANWIEAFPDAHVDVHDVVISDDVAVEEGTFTGTHNKGVFHSPMGDIPATGRAVRSEYIQVLRYRDGTFFSANLMFDRMELLDQLGLLRRRPPPADSAGVRDSDAGRVGRRASSRVPAVISSAACRSLTGVAAPRLLRSMHLGTRAERSRARRPVSL